MFYECRGAERPPLGRSCGRICRIELAAVLTWLTIVFVASLSEAQYASPITVTVSNEAQLAQALANNSIAVAQLAGNLRLSGSSWPAVPIVRSADFTIFGGPEYPLCDLAFIEGKIMLEPGVRFNFEQVELRNTRQRSGFEVDLFTASPGAYVRYTRSIYFCFSCLPPALIRDLMMAAPASTLPQNISIGAPWCRTQRPIAACYTNVNNTFRAHTVSSMLAVSGLQGVSSGGGYVLEAVDVLFVCEDPVSDECASQKGYDFCVRNQIQAMYEQDDTWTLLEKGTSRGNRVAVVIAPAVAGSVGGTLLLLVAVASVMLWHRRRRRLSAGTADELGHTWAGHRLPGDAPAASVLLEAVPTATLGSGKDNGQDTYMCALARQNSSESAGQQRLLLSPSAGHLDVEKLPGASRYCEPPSAAAGGAAAPGEWQAAASIGSSSPGLPSSGQLVADVSLENGPVVAVAGITIELSKALGTGSFGKVFKGSWQGYPVAVKVLQYGAELCRAVHNEVLLSQSLRHPNIVAALHFAQVMPGGRLGLATSGPMHARDHPGGWSPNPGRSAQAEHRNPSGPATSSGTDLAGDVAQAAAAAAAGIYSRFILDGSGVACSSATVGVWQDSGGSAAGSGGNTGGGPVSSNPARANSVVPLAPGKQAGWPDASVMSAAAAAAASTGAEAAPPSSEQDEADSSRGVAMQGRAPPPAGAELGVATVPLEDTGGRATGDGGAGHSQEITCSSPSNVVTGGAVGPSAQSSGAPTRRILSEHANARGYLVPPSVASVHGGVMAMTAAPSDGPSGEAGLVTSPVLECSSRPLPPYSGSTAGQAQAHMQPGSPAEAVAAAMPLEALWLAAHVQPADGSSHGFLVMELCEGGSAWEWRKTRWCGGGQLPDMALLARLALDVALGMAFIHGQGVCHGDLKLSNVLLARPGGPLHPGSPRATPEPQAWVAKVCDFGLARVLTVDRTHVSTRPHGTPTHMAPELWAEGHVSPQADVYAFGMTLWELCTGERPYRDLNAARILHRVMISGGRPPVPPWLPPAYALLMTACWAQAPKERPAFGEIVGRLQAMIASFGTRQQPAR